MDQLRMSFQEEILLKLKKTDWEFETKPDSQVTPKPKEKFIELDCSTPDNKNSTPTKENILKIEF